MRTSGVLVIAESWQSSGSGDGGGKQLRLSLFLGQGNVFFKASRRENKQKLQAACANPFCPLLMFSLCDSCQPVT